MNDREHIAHLLNSYARACDFRDWELLKQVFAADATACYGGHSFGSRNALIGVIRASLEGCGPTQHLLGNCDFELHGDTARSACYVRAAHIGLGEHQGVFYEVWGEYRDSWRHREGRWQISHRELVIVHEIGDRGVLKPAL